MSGACLLTLPSVAQEFAHNSCVLRRKRRKKERMKYFPLWGSKGTSLSYTICPGCLKFLSCSPRPPSRRGIIIISNNRYVLSIC
jgi:hypothetical protein